jgi:hypothetical protein
MKPGCKFSDGQKLALSLTNFCQLPAAICLMISIEFDWVGIAIG